MATNNACNYVPVNHDTMVGATLGQITPISTGTTSQVLTSNGSLSDPSYQNVPFIPNANITISDDFLFSANDVSGFVTGSLTWNTSTTLAMAISAPIDNAHPGLLKNPSIITGASYILANSTNSSFSLILAGGSITINWVFNLAIISSASPRYTLRMGLGDTVAADQANGAYFEYSDNINSGNWVIKTASASSLTTTNSSTAATVAWHNAQISINAAGTLVTYTMDGVSLGTIATNIPITAISPFIQIIEVSGTVAASTLLVDLMYLNQTLTSAR